MMKYEIEKYSPCPEAVEFRAKFKTFEEAWNACEHGDWMLWIAAKVGVDLKLLTLTKGHCANTVRQLMKDERSLKAVDTAIAFGEGSATRKELDTAADAADAADAAYAADAADAAAYAARKENRKLTADICRKYLTKAVLEHFKK